MTFSKEQLTAYDKATILCSQSERCTAELIEKFKLWGLSEEAFLPVLSKLVAEKFIDDQRYACAYAKDKFRFNHWGKQKIAYMLQSKNISPEMIKMALEEIEIENYTDDLRKLLSDKAKNISAKNAFDKRNKLFRFALSRGFETDKIYLVLKELGI